MNNLMFYLASPYTHKLKTVMKEREKDITQLALKLHNRGLTVYSPITHSIGLMKYSKHKPHGFNEWKKDDLIFVEKSDGLIVVKMPDWEESVGVQAEIRYADDRMIDTYYLDYPYEDLDINKLLNEINYACNSSIYG